MNRMLYLAIALTVGLAPDVVGESNWPEFRGGRLAGVVEDPDLPQTWSTTSNIAWKTEIPGRGWSSPVVWGDKIFLTSAIKDGEEETPKKGRTRQI